jgi:hypothetical protein
MKNSAKLFLIFYLTLIFNNIQAQSGGPPMMTDDPGVVDLHKFEINLSINTSFSNNMNEFAVPFADINYGIAKNLQLKVEFPYLLDYTKNKTITNALGDAVVGLKWKIVDEEKYFLSVGTYPQYTFYGAHGFLLPLLLEKTFGKFLVGEDFGSFWGQHNVWMLHNGTLLGYKFSDRFETMGEYYVEQTVNPDSATDCFVNLGFRYAQSDHVGWMCSLGTQVISASPAEREKFFSFLGVQLHF